MNLTSKHKMVISAILCITMLIIVVNPVTTQSEGFYIKEKSYINLNEFRYGSATFLNSLEETIETNADDLPQLGANNIQTTYEAVEAVVVTSSEDELNIEQEEVELDDDEEYYISYPSEDLSDRDTYKGYMTKYMNLKCRMKITTDQMNMMINTFAEPGSLLIGNGQAFIDAAKETNLDPVFLLALAAMESGWDTSDLHRRKNNPYSINMVDSNPEAGYHMGDTFADGIINGAIWIKLNYYDEGQQTLYDMNYGKKKYCSNSDHWIRSICSIMEDCYGLIY